MKKSLNYYKSPFEVIKDEGWKKYTQYLILKLRRKLGFRIFKLDVNNPVACTKNNTITIGEEYQYKEGSCLERMILEDVQFVDYYIKIKVCFIETGRRFTATSLLKPHGYSGMWTIWDKGRFDIEKWKKYREEDEIDYDALNNLPVITIP